MDQLTRFMLAHYIAAYYYAYALQVHVMFIHEAWDSESGQSILQDSALPKLSWLWDALQKESAIMTAAYTVSAA